MYIITNIHNFLVDKVFLRIVMAFMLNKNKSIPRKQNTMKSEEDGTNVAVTNGCSVTNSDLLPNGSTDFTKDIIGIPE